MSTFPMIAPDGSTAEVPEASMKAALAAGAKHAVQMLGPDGSKAYVPMDQAHVAMQKGASPIGGLPALRLPEVKENLTGNIYAGVRDFGKTALGNNPVTAAQSLTGNGLTELVSQDEQQRIKDEGGFLAKSKLSNIGSNTVEDLKNTFAPGDTTGARVGSGAANAVTLGRTIHAARGLNTSTRVPLEKLPDGHLNNLRKVANPDVNDLHFDAKFMKHGGEAISQFEQTNGHLPQTTHELGTAFLDSAKANRELYYGKMISSVESDPLSTPNGYGGAKLTPGTASVRQLDARLTDINNTLEPKFARGGPGSQQAQAAVGAGEARALKAEAASIRAILYPYLGQRLGLTAEQVGGIRDSFGAQRHIGETILISENERFARTAGKEMTPKGLTINPLSNTKEFVLDKALNAMRSSESPADRAVREAMAQVRTGGMQRPTPNVQPPQTPPPRTPAWKAGENGGRTPPTATTIKPPTAPPKPDEMIDSLRFRINDLSTKLRKADASEKGEIEAELSRTKEMINSLSPRAKESSQSLKPQGEQAPSYRTPESVMLAMKSGTLSQTEGNRLLQKLRGKSHAVTRPIPPPP
jgi:hypothetical protein